MSTAALPPIRDADPDDFAAILRLNAEDVAVLSPLDRDRLQHLHAQAALHRVIGGDDGVQAFLLALREGADYDSPNYRWFAARHPRFLYIDRIVVAPATRARGWATRLYRDAIAHAHDTDVGMLCCEIDAEPPNPPSQAFHARLGFREVDRQILPGGKTVSLQALML